MKKRINLEQKQVELTDRQNRLREQLQEEKKQLDNEMVERQRPKSRHVPLSVLDSVRTTLSNAEKCRERADLESTLYSKWRLGLDQEKILKESKNTHQAMAKLSWLDRQLENQLKNEKQRQESNVLELKLEDEKRKHEAYVISCAELRNTEMNQVKTLQENHIQELKLREREAHDLKLMESTLRKKLEEIQKEVKNICATNNKRRDRAQALNNFRKIKMMMRERSDAVKRDLQQDLNLLDRISFDQDFDNNEEICYLRQKFQGQYDNETQNLQQIEGMYESEAKESLRKQEEKWNDDGMVRERQLKVLMDDRIQTINDRIHDCVRKQHDLASLRESHTSAIEDCNKRLKELMSSSLSENSQNLPSIDANAKGMIRNSESISDLKFPKFGRKKIAWT